MFEFVFVLVFLFMLPCANNSPLKKDLTFLKQLLLYRMAEANTLSPMSITTMGTLSTSVTTTELSVIVSNFTASPLMDDFYNVIFTGNGTVEKEFQSMFKSAVPNLKALSANTTDRLTKQRALVELAVQMQPLIAPLAANHPNLTSKVTALGQFLESNRTGRDGGYGGGGGGGGWGGGCCGCCGGSSWGTPVMMVKSWGGDGWGGGGGGGNNNELLSYLLAKGGKGSDDNTLQTLLPLLFGLIALLIMKLPT